MNKTLAGSSVLAVAGMLSALLPFPGLVLMPVLVTAGWIWLAVAKTVRTPEAPLDSADPITVAEPVPVDTSQDQPAPIPEPLVESLYRHRSLLEVVQGLKRLAVSDTERSVLRLTEALFTLVGNSKEVSAQIEKSLGFVSGGAGLGQTLAHLEDQVRVFGTLAEHFGQLKEGLATDIDSLGRAVGSINRFSETLSDLADQTNVLAINASIEAARVGIHGRGFAVIASQVQGLAKNSKDISETMARTIREVVASVEESFERQTQRIQESQGLITNSESQLRQWAGQAAPQLAEVATMVSSSRQLASVVTQQLNDVTVSLQFQDRTKQILDHLAAVLDESAARVFASVELGACPAMIRDEALRSASRHFTVKEEWTLLPEGPRRGDDKAVELF